MCTQNTCPNCEEINDLARRIVEQFGDDQHPSVIISALVEVTSDVISHCAPSLSAAMETIGNIRSDLTNRTLRSHQTRDLPPAAPRAASTMTVN